MLIIMSFSVSLIASVNAQDCGDGELDPNEYCDKPSGGTLDDIVWFNGIDSCSEIKTSWIDDPNLDCYESGSGGQECQLDVNGCSEVGGGPGGVYCNSCNAGSHSCEGDESFDGTTCTQRECSYQCPAFGGCFYTPGHIFGDQCTDCDSVNECEDYENEFDCRANVCVMLDKVCDWIGGTCKENLDCTWNCDGLYGEPDANGMCHKQTKECEGGSYIGCCLAGYVNSPNDFYKQQCLANNPANNYPDEIVCKQLQEQFPIFTSFNLFLSIFLLISYYVIIQRKKFT